MPATLDIMRFFRKAPKAWLQKYFARHKLLLDFDWPLLKTRNIGPLYAAWLELEPEFRQRAAADFRDIASLGDAVGKLAIIDEAVFHPGAANIATTFEGLEDFLACAFYTLLEHPKLWNGALSFADADNKNGRYWRTRNNMPRLGRKPTYDDAKNLGVALSALLTRTEGRGIFCEVQPYRRRDLEYFFAYPQDHRQTSLVYDKAGNWKKRPHNPSFEIIFVLNDRERTLKSWHQGGGGRVKDLQVAFARAVLGADIPRESEKDTRVYDLQHFMNQDFSLRIAPDLGIRSAELRKIRLRVNGPNKHTIRIDLGNDCQSHILYDRLNEVTRDIPPTLVQITQVGIRVTYEKELGEKNERHRDFAITSPNLTSLSDDDEDQALRRLLVENGVEPQLRTEGADHGSEDE